MGTGARVWQHSDKEQAGNPTTPPATAKAGSLSSGMTFLSGGGQEATRWQRAQVTSQNRSLPGTQTLSAPSLPHWETGRDEVWIEVSCQKHTAEPFCLRGLGVSVGCVAHRSGKGRNHDVGAEGRKGIPETCSVQCPDAELDIQFFSELVLGGQGILGGAFSCQIVSSVVTTTGVLVSGPRDGELPQNDNETVYKNKTTNRPGCC